MNETQRIADSYRAATVKGAWYGPTLAELLAGISPELAIKAPLPEAHSIAALLQHLLLWNERIRNTSDSNLMPRWDAEREWAEAAGPLERSRHPLEPKPRSARRKDSEFSRCGFDETGRWTQLSLRNDVPWNCAARDLSFWPNRHGLKHAAVAINVAPTSMPSLHAG